MATLLPEAMQTTRAGDPQCTLGPARDLFEVGIAKPAPIAGQHRLEHFELSGDAEQSDAVHRRPNRSLFPRQEKRVCSPGRPARSAEQGEFEALLLRIPASEPVVEADPHRAIGTHGQSELGEIGPFRCVPAHSLANTGPRVEAP